MFERNFPKVLTTFEVLHEKQELKNRSEQKDLSYVPKNEGSQKVLKNLFKKILSEVSRTSPK